MSPIDRQAAFSGTKDVSGTLALDAARLEVYLASRLPDFVAPLRVRQFKGGQSNPTYLLETPARRYVLRRKPPGQLLPSAHAVDREFRVISALHAQKFPVAAPLLYCDDASVAGTAFYLMDHVEGRVVWEPHMPDTEPAERAAVYDAMNATLARLHSSDPTALGLSDFGRGDNYVARQVERWSKQYRASETEPIEEMEQLVAWLPAHLPPPAPVSVPPMRTQTLEATQTRPSAHVPSERQSQRSAPGEQGGVVDLPPQAAPKSAAANVSPDPICARSVIRIVGYPCAVFP